jgi:uncharacterized membrane protein YphA (DoxX/SURF4 family)
MPITSKLGRPMLAAMFVSGGIDSLRNPEQKAKVAADVATTISEPFDSLPDDPVALVRLNGALQVAGGVLLALGKLPRVAALLLAGSLVPTTIAGHPFWEIDDDKERNGQRIHFMKNVAMLGGLLIAAGDTEGRPSLQWRAKRAAHHAAEKVEHVVERVEDHLPFAA